MFDPDDRDPYRVIERENRAACSQEYEPYFE